MNNGKITAVPLAVAAAVLLAAGLRFINLGNLPLSESEAGWALQAFEAARGGKVLWGGQPGYLALTAANFFLFGATEFWARFWSALAGTLLVASPLLFKKYIGSAAALVLAFGLALEPVLVAAARQADGRMLAIAGLVFALGFWLQGNLPWAGISLGLMLLGGPTAWLALAAMALAAMAARVKLHAPQGEAGYHWRELGLWTGGTLLVAGTLGGIFPTGLSAWANSLVAFFEGWTQSMSVSAWLMLVAWLGVGPLAVVFGLGGVAAGWRERQRVDEFLSWAWAFLFVLFLIYPARQTADLAWSAVPLLGLAARQVARLRLPEENRIPLAGYAILSGILMVTATLNVSGLSINMLPDEETMRLRGILGVGFLVLASFFLITWGWSLRLARYGLMLGVSGALLAYTLSSAAAAGGLGTRPENEIWIEGKSAAEQATATKVIGDVAEWVSGRRDTLAMTVSGVDSSLMRWALRGQIGAEVKALTADATPQAVLTLESKDMKLGLATAYTGQGLDWSRQVRWQALEPEEWIHWLLFREVPSRTGVLDKQSVILWVRSDLFPGVAKSSAGR